MGNVSRIVFARTLGLVMTLGLIVACSDVGPTAVDPTPNSPLAPSGPLLSTSEVERVATSQAQTALSTAQTVGNAGGTITLDGGHSIYFPAGALASDVSITMERVEGDFIQVKMGPHGTQFPADAQPELTLNWSSAESPNTLTMVVAYVDSAGAILETYQGVIDETNKTIRAKLPHFSGFAVAQ